MHCNTVNSAWLLGLSIVFHNKNFSVADGGRQELFGEACWGSPETSYDRQVLSLLTVTNFIVDTMLPFVLSLLTVTNFIVDTMLPFVHSYTVDIRA